MSIKVEENVRLSDHTTLKVGGAASYFVVVKNVNELIEAAAWAQEKGCPFKVLGGGSNLLVSDSGFAGLVIKNEIAGLEAEEVDGYVLLKVGAGEVLDEVISHTVKNGWWGMENLSHIPGTAGAAPIQNVGAYGVEVKDVIESVGVYSAADNSFQELSAAECGFGYRDSIFKRGDGRELIVTSVTFALSKLPKPVLSYRDLANRFPGATAEQKDIRDAVIEIRSKKFPDWTKVGTAGSFFKNPVVVSSVAEELLKKYPDLPTFPVGDDKTKLALGYLLDKVCGLKGYTEGSVGTYKGQALVLINHGGATATEVEEFAGHITQIVKDKVGVEIEWEVTRW